MAVMKKIGSLLSFLGPVLVIGALLAFAGYALWLYQPDQAASCAKSGFAQQFDVAVHVVRQWAGKEGQNYLTCE
jgi:hypothetical protein